MRRLFFIFIISFISLHNLSAQNADSASLEARSTYIIDSTNRAELERSSKQGQEVFYTIQTESTSKQKKKAITNIAIGLLFLLVLIVGLMRKRKKVQTPVQ